MTLAQGLELILQALRLDPAAFAQQASLNNSRLALAVVFFAGLSQSLGQSVILFANRVKPRRFIASLILAAGLYVFGFFFLGLSIWLVAHYVFNQNVSATVILNSIALAYAPYLLGFFSLAPYFGTLIGILLSLWSLAAILVALQIVLGLSLMQAVLCSALGWLVLQVLGRTLGRPIHRLARASRRWVAGQPLEQNLERLWASLKDPQP